MTDVLSALAPGGALARDRVLRDKAAAAVAVLDRAMDLYGATTLAFSFNGGKDSTVLLHLLRAAIARREADDKPTRATDGDRAAAAAAGAPPFPDGDLGAVRTFIFQRDDDFDEIGAFVADADARHGLGVVRVAGPMAHGLTSFLAATRTAAVVLGTRRGDPNAGGQDTFCPSSPGWPPFMRVNPILGWGYGDVWAFLDAIRAPYCPLYDRGYTSIGAKPSTRPNSALLRPDGRYAPARELTDGRAERAGRAAASTPAPGATPRGLLTRAAAVVVVGDELLSGRVADANGAFVCAALRAAGWAAARVAILPDDVPAVAAEIEAGLDAVGVVLVCGGVGPTPDDVTMAAVAAAFGVPLARDADLEARLRAYFGAAATDAHLKMADAPACGVEAIEVAGAPPGAPRTAVDGGGGGGGGGDAPSPRSPFPLIACPHPAGRGTVYVLPGVPHLLRRKWPALAAHLAASTGGAPLAPFRSVALALALADESTAAPAIAAAVAAAGGAVAAGSYPVAPRGDGATVVLLLESKDEAALATAVGAAKGALPAGALVGEEADPDGLGGGTPREGGRP